VNDPEVTKFCLNKESSIILQREICNTGDHAVAEFIRENMLSSTDMVTVDWGGQGLGRIGDPCAIPALLKALERPERQAQNGVKIGLAGCADGRHPESYQALLDHLTVENSVVRQGAIVGLGSCRDARAVPSLIVVLKTDPVPEVREFTALALGLIGDTRAVAPLCATLHDEVEWARSAAAWALGEIGDARAIPFLRDAARIDANKRFVVRAARSLYVLGDKDAAETLAEMINSDDMNNRVVAFAALLECDEQRIAGSLLATLAQNPDAQIIRALGRLRAPQAVNTLIGVLDEPEYTWQGNQRREAAAWALGMIAEGRQGDWVRETADVLHHSAQADAEPQVRAAAGLAFARMGDPRALDLLEWIMRRYVPERNAAIRALWRFADARATALLGEALDDDDPLGQVLAARGLYLREDPRGREALATLATTVTEPVAKQVAIRFAADLRDPALAPLFIHLAQAQHEEASIFIVLEAIAALGKTATPESEQALVDLLASPASRVREAAALALKGTTSPAALAVLRARLENEEASRVRTAMQAVVGEH